MIRNFFFIARIAIAWMLMVVLFAIVWESMPLIGEADPWPVFLLGFIVIGFVITSAVSHLRRVRLISGLNSSEAVGNRQRRQIDGFPGAGTAEFNFPGDDAARFFDDTQYRLDRRTFAAAAFADDTQNLTGINVKTDAVDRVDRAFIEREHRFQITHRQQRFGFNIGGHHHQL